MSQRSALVIALLATCLSLDCVDLGRTVDTTGTLSVQLDAYDGTTSVAKASLRGPARLRRLSAQTILVAARVVRPDPSGTRRGDLFLRLAAPHPLSPNTRFFGDLSDTTITYDELDSRTGTTQRFGGAGNVRLDFVPQAAAPSIQVALELTLHPLAAQGASRSLRLRGVVQSDGGRAVSRDIGTGLWLDDFDLDALLASPEYDFESYLEDPAVTADWVTAGTTESPPGFGHFDFGSGGEVGAVDSSSGDSGTTFDPGFTGTSDTGTSDSGTSDTGTSGAGTSGAGTTYDDDADGGCQGDKATQDTSQCGTLRATPRGVCFLTVLGVLALARALRRRRQPK